MKYKNYDISGDNKLLNYRCIRDLTGEENILVGRYGYVSPFDGEDLYLIVFWSSQIAKKHGVEISKGEEGAIVVPSKMAKIIRKDLKTFRSMKDQVDMLINQNSRSE